MVAFVASDLSDATAASLLGVSFALLLQHENKALFEFQHYAHGVM